MPSDHSIEHDVIRRLDQSLDIGGHVEVTVKDGVVTLRGSVDDYHAKCTAFELAHDVSGVAYVQSFLVVSPEWGEERGPMQTEFSREEDAEAMTSPDYRLIDSV